MLYIMFCLCTWGARLCCCHDSSQVFTLFDLFLFFFNCVCPQDSTPLGVPTDINVNGGDPDMEIEGGTTCSFGAIVNLIAKQEGIGPRLQKRWDRFLG